jgi:dCMP deaminase
MPYLKLSLAQNHADNVSQCVKVKVGAVIAKGPNLYLGANRTIPEGCDGVACNKVLPHDGLPHCVSTIHAEVDAITRAKTNLTGATAYVTRYPCENCARVLVTAGITKVIYGRPQKISEDTERIFKAYNVVVIHKPNFNPEGE